MAYKDIRVVDADGTIINAIAILDDGNEQLQAISPDHPDFKALKAGKFGPVAEFVAPPFNSDPVKSECQRRIYAVASQNTQMNMTAYVARGLAPNADKTAFAHSLEWVSAMRAASAGLIDDEDVTFANDTHWPTCPADAVELASRF